MQRDKHKSIWIRFLGLRFFLGKHRAVIIKIIEIAAVVTKLPRERRKLRLLASSAGCKSRIQNHSTVARDCGSYCGTQLFALPHKASSMPTTTKALGRPLVTRLKALLADREIVELNAVVKIQFINWL